MVQSRGGKTRYHARWDTRCVPKPITMRTNGSYIPLRFPRRPTMQSDGQINDILGSFSTDRQRWCCKGPCHDVLFLKAPWGASARRYRHPSSSRFPRYTVSWRPSPSTVAWAYSNRCSKSSPLGRTTTSCTPGFPSRMSWRTSLEQRWDRLAVNAGSILTSAIAASHCTCILSLARMHCVGILAAWTTAAPVLAPTLPIHPLARLSTFGIAKRTKVLIQDRCCRHISRQGAVRGQEVQTSFKTSACCKAGGTRQGGCRLTDPVSCAKIGVVAEKKIG